MSVILCGMPMSGKTTLGKRLAASLGLDFIDTDRLIEEAYATQTGCELNCRQIYKEIGQLKFRSLEKQQLSLLKEKPDSVIAIGGGTLEDPENSQLLKSCGTLIYLKTSPNILLERIFKRGVPAYLDTENPKKTFENLAKSRIPIFEKCADAVLDLDHLTEEEAVEKLVAIANASEKKPKKITCKLPAAQYEIIIQSGILNNADFLVRHLGKLGAKYAIITDTHLKNLHGEKLQKLMMQSGLETLLFAFPAGEEHKNRAIKEELENRLFENKMGRDTCMIALGGGVVTDLGGFLAATYCRGVPLVMVPTSLLGMVDASIGGKNGVDVPYGKNLVGSIYQPKMVIIDPLTIQTLPVKEVRNGAVEMIKHGLIVDRTYFCFLDEKADQILSCDSNVLEKAIFESCLIKKTIVEQDETETGKRRLLNFGHTIGHALEHLTHYSITHGEAVAIGLLVESHLAVQLGYLRQEELDSIFKTLKKFGLPLKLPGHFSFEQLLGAMTLDKKSQKGTPRFVMIDAIGSAMPCDGAYCMPVEDRVLFNAFTWMDENFFVQEQDSL